MNAVPEKSTLPNYRWIKFEIDYLNSPEFMQLSEGAVGTYLKLYLLAGKADAGGLLCSSNKAFNIEDLGWFLRCSCESISSHVQELQRVGLMTIDKFGFRITRFVDEQGPGDDTKREAWRNRQNKHRERVKTEEKIEKEKEKEKEKDEDVDEDIESHGDVTVTHEPPHHSGASLLTDEEILQNIWVEWNGTKLGKKKLHELVEMINAESSIEDWQSRFTECIILWHHITEKHPEKGWFKGNPDVIFDLYPVPNLEERMEREGLIWENEMKEFYRKEVLNDHGL